MCDTSIKSQQLGRSINKDAQPQISHIAPTQGIEVDAPDELSLPYRSLTSEAKMRAYITGKPSSNTIREAQSIRPAVLNATSSSLSPSAT